MSFRDQKKYIEALRKYEKKFDRREADDYKMFVKMNKDDEDFDSISLRRLKELYDKYNTPVDRSKYDAFFKKKEGWKINWRDRSKAINFYNLPLNIIKTLSSGRKICVRYYYTNLSSAKLPSRVKSHLCEIDNFIS